MILTFQSMLGDLPASSCRRPASTGGNSDPEPPQFVLLLLREKREKVTSRGAHSDSPFEFGSRFGLGDCPLGLSDAGLLSPCCSSAVAAPPMRVNLTPCPHRQSGRRSGGPGGRAPQKADPSEAYLQYKDTWTLSGRPSDHHFADHDFAINAGWRLSGARG